MYNEVLAFSVYSKYFVCLVLLHLRLDLRQS